MNIYKFVYMFKFILLHIIYVHTYICIYNVYTDIGLCVLPQPHSPGTCIRLSGVLLVVLNAYDTYIVRLESLGVRVVPKQTASFLKLFVR